MSLTKAELRRELKRARLILTPAERAAKSTAINGRLWEALDWSGAGRVHCYEPIERLGEVDITDFITALQTEHPKLQLFTSRQINGAWHIVSLKDEQPVVPNQLDVIIVPMLGFDPVSLHRIGYGGGYYDRFLVAQPQARTIGVCFNLGLLPDVPTEPHDVPLDIIVTESMTHKINLVTQKLNEVYDNDERLTPP